MDTEPAARVVAAMLTRALRDAARGDTAAVQWLSCESTRALADLAGHGYSLQELRQAVAQLQADECERRARVASRRRPALAPAVSPCG